MKIDILTAFPEMITPVTDTSIARIAQEKGHVEVSRHDIRDFTQDKHRKIDDYPFGGGDGMIYMPQPLWNGLDFVTKAAKNPRIIFPTPDGTLFTQSKAEELSQCDHLIFICGHYKGIDQRIRDHWVTDEISIGDYVLTSGEIATLVILDALIRLIPGVIGTLESAKEDSFSYPLLDTPWYSRPEEFAGYKVPEVLLSGHHAQINAWRLDQRIQKTKIQRPDLYKKYLEEKIKRK